jgi:hypothetical protein
VHAANAPNVADFLARRLSDEYVHNYVFALRELAGRYPAVELTWGTVFLIVAGTIVVWFWQDSLRVRDVANAAAIEACTRLGLQFLDGTVAFTRLRPVRDVGQMRLRRTYIFDYTAHSIDRLQGFVVMLGMRVESVGFARDEAQRERTAASDTRSPTSDTPATPTVADDASDKVLDLQEWRRNRDQRH